MNIYEYAMKMEKDSENYYRELATETEYTGLKNIFTMLADEEVKHFNVVKGMIETDANAELAETDVLLNAKNIFIEMKEAGRKFDFDLPQTDVYRKAREIEKNSNEFYVEMSGKVENEAQREIFLQLAAEEEKHMFLIENIIEFVSRPETWIENAEFNHLDDY